MVGRGTKPWEVCLDRKYGICTFLALTAGEAVMLLCTVLRAFLVGGLLPSCFVSREWWNCFTGFGAEVCSSGVSLYNPCLVAALLTKILYLCIRVKINIIGLCKIISSNEVLKQQISKLWVSKAVRS